MLSATAQTRCLNSGKQTGSPPSMLFCKLQQLFECMSSHMPAAREMPLSLTNLASCPRLIRSAFELNEVYLLWCQFVLTPLTVVHDERIIWEVIMPPFRDQESAILDDSPIRKCVASPWRKTWLRAHVRARHLSILTVLELASSSAASTCSMPHVRCITCAD